MIYENLFLSKIKNIISSNIYLFNTAYRGYDE